MIFEIIPIVLNCATLPNFILLYISAMNEDINVDAAINEAIANNPEIQAMMADGQMPIEAMTSVDAMMPMIAGAGVVANVITIVFFLLKAWGLYNINKKLGEPYPWLSWIPVIQMYSFVKAGGKNGMWVLWIILGYIFFIIPGLILSIIVMHETSKRTGRGVWTTLGFIFIGFIMYPVVGHKLQAAPANNDADMIKPTIPNTENNSDEF